MEIKTDQATTFILETFKLDKLALFIFLIFCIVIFVKFLTAWSKKLQNKYTSKRLIILQLTTMFSFSLYLFGTMGVFYIIFKPTKEVLLAVGGSAAVAIGFALKDLVGSIIAGFILLFDRPFQVGDRVQFGDDYGEIMSIGLRSVKLNTLDDNLVTIPNSKFLTDTVASGNAGALDMMVVANFYISIYESLDRVKDILHEVVITSRFVFLEKPIKINFEEVAVSNTFVIKVSVKSYVLDVKYEKAYLTDIVERSEKQLRLAKIMRPVVNPIPEENSTNS